MDLSRSEWSHQEAEPLQLPRMLVDSSSRSLNSPTFDRIRPLSNMLSSPPPILGNQFHTSSPNHPSKPYEGYPSTNPYAKADEMSISASLGNSPHTVNPSQTNHMYAPTSNQAGSINDRWSPAVLNASRLDTKPADRSSSSTTQVKTYERPSMNPNSTRTNERWLPNDSSNRSGSNAFTSNTASDIRMIKSSNNTSGSVNNRCSPRCKLGLLGFAIGFLAVGIAVAVVLVLWLRRA